MCPACIATATLVVTGATSAGGVTALVVKLLHAKKTKKSKQNPQ
jgi:hypothetical protein